MKPEDASARCPICRQYFGDAGDMSVVGAFHHLVLNHPTEEVTLGMVEDAEVTAPCRECGSWFDTDVRVDVENHILCRDAVCPGCVEEKPLKSAYVVPTKARAVVEGRETDENKPEDWTVPKRYE